MTPEPTHKGELVAMPPKYLIGIPIYDDVEQLAERSIERAMNAATPEELLADPESGGLRDLAGQAITITAVLGIMPSTIKDGDYYIVFEAATPPNGELSILTTGSRFAAARIATLAAKGWLPRAVRVVELESTANKGQSSLWVVDAVQPTPGSVEQGF